MLHELAHGLAMESVGRPVQRAGLKLLFVFPYAFVDTSEVWFEPRRRRQLVTVAGPLSDFALAGLFAIICLVLSPGTMRDICFQVATGGYIAALFNLNPFLERDGYHLLADGLRVPGLRGEGAGAAAARGFPAPAAPRPEPALIRVRLGGRRAGRSPRPASPSCSRSATSPRSRPSCPEYVVWGVFGTIGLAMLIPAFVVLGPPLVARARGRGAAEADRVSDGRRRRAADRAPARRAGPARRRSAATRCRCAGRRGSRSSPSRCRARSGKALMTLDIRESRSSLAGVMMAAALEGFGIYQLVEHVGPALGDAPDAVHDVLSRVNLPAVGSLQGALSAPPAEAAAGAGNGGANGAPSAVLPAAPRAGGRAADPACGAAAARAQGRRRALPTTRPRPTTRRRPTTPRRRRPTTRPSPTGSRGPRPRPTIRRRSRGTRRSRSTPGQFGQPGTGGDPDPEALALLKNKNIILDADGITDIKQGRIDPRVVAVLTKLSEDHKIQVSCMSRDHPFNTVGGSVSNHSYGRGMDIAAVDGVPVNAANIDARDVATQLNELDPKYRPTEIGSPWSLGPAAAVLHRRRPHRPHPRRLRRRDRPAVEAAGRTSPPGARAAAATVAEAARRTRAAARSGATRSRMPIAGSRSGRSGTLSGIAAADQDAPAPKRSEPATPTWWSWPTSRAARGRCQGAGRGQGGQEVHGDAVPLGRLDARTPGSTAPA